MCCQVIIFAVLAADLDPFYCTAVAVKCTTFYIIKQSAYFCLANLTKHWQK